jgi:hypothetical protein
MSHVEAGSLGITLPHGSITFYGPTFDALQGQQQHNNRQKSQPQQRSIPANSGAFEGSNSRQFEPGTYPTYETQALKGTDLRFLTLGFFHESVSPRPLNIQQGPFQIFMKICGDIYNFVSTMAINYCPCYCYQ